VRIHAPLPSNVPSFASAVFRQLPRLNPGKLPDSYITLGAAWRDGPSAVRDLDAERTEKLSSTLAVPAPPIPPPELTNSGKPLTKKEKKSVGYSHAF